LKKFLKENKIYDIKFNNLFKENDNVLGDILNENPDLKRKHYGRKYLDTYYLENVPETIISDDNIYFEVQDKVVMNTKVELDVQPKNDIENTEEYLRDLIITNTDINNIELEQNFTVQEDYLEMGQYNDFGDMEEMGKEELFEKSTNWGVDDLYVIKPDKVDKKKKRIGYMLEQLRYQVDYSLLQYFYHLDINFENYDLDICNYINNINEILKNNNLPINIKETLLTLYMTNVFLKKTENKKYSFDFFFKGQDILLYMLNKNDINFKTKYFKYIHKMDAERVWFNCNLNGFLKKYKEDLFKNTYYKIIILYGEVINKTYDTYQPNFMDYDQYVNQ
jgi:hypothetical protein